jgi:tetratricopeptide (TPR) repeat protein
VSLSKPSSVRVHSAAYLSAAGIFSFAAAFLLFLGYDIASLIVVAAGLASYPILAFQDRILFDGKRIRRTGIVWRLFRRSIGQRSSIRPRAVIHVETETLRSVRRGSNITYLYRTSLYASDLSFTIGSGRGYREMIAAVLPLIPEGCLDIRSIELRDHLTDPVDVAHLINEFDLPSSEVLDPQSILSKSKGVQPMSQEPGHEDLERSRALRSVGNKLRAAGRLLQSIEAFRRALLVTPKNGELLYEFARCLQSFAATRRDAKAERKFQAMLRLAERHSGGDADLLTRIGETYFSVGSWKRAENALRRAAESERAGFRIFRGLGELALRDGKIAHAINHFARSADLAGPRPLSKWARSEAEYLRRLNNDDEYMELEISRMNLFDNLDGARRTAFRIVLFGLAILFVGLIAGQPILTNAGWAVTGISIVVWVSSTALRQAFASRLPFDLIDKER